MELDIIESVSYSDGMEDDDYGVAVTSALLPGPFFKFASIAGAAIATAAAVNVVVVSNRLGAAGPGGAGAGPLVKW
jgi:E3 ubiquitin-protein ligase SIAH1